VDLPIPGNDDSNPLIEADPGQAADSVLEGKAAIPPPETPPPGTRTPRPQPQPAMNPR